jgi:hypothetical protein
MILGKVILLALILLVIAWLLGGALRNLRR